jgi:solute carrier family 25 citrate transporter 1
MPLDNIKTRMQSTGAESRYAHSLDCFVKIVREEGVAKLWGGTTPRLARLMVSGSGCWGCDHVWCRLQIADAQLSGGIVFAVYDKLITAMTAL